MDTATIAPAIAPPSLISAAHEVWGADPEGFWNELSEACEKERLAEATGAAVLEEIERALEVAVSDGRILSDSPEQVRSEADLWLVGDLHGDLLALRVLTEFAARTSKRDGRQAGIVFLGDLFDDGPFSHAVLRDVLKRVNTTPTLDAFVVGNHDLSPSWSETDGRFIGDVMPHDFADWLNLLPGESPWRRFSRAAFKWFAGAPRAILLADGTLLAHGGCVHADRLGLLGAEMNWKDNADVLEDLVWLRAHDTAKRKVPNRTARGCQFGIHDLSDFLAKLSEVVGRPVVRVVRGHDHVVDRWSAPASYQGQLLTLNAMSWQQRDVFGPFVRQPVIARHRPWASHELFQLEIPEKHVLRLYGEPPLAPCDTCAV